MHVRSVLLMALTALVPAAAAAQARSGGLPAGSWAQLADSAGVPVVTNPAVLPASLVPWRFSDRPVLILGGRTVPGDSLIRVRGGAVLSDGRVVLADEGTLELRFFDASGAPGRSAGRAGRVPGTFQRVQIIGPFAGDSLLVHDVGQQRFSVFAPGGDYVRSFAVPRDLVIGSSVIGVLTDGSPVLRRPWPLAAPTTPLFYRRRVRIDVVTRDGRVGPTLGEFPGTESSNLTVSGGGYTGAMAGAFGRSAYHFAAGDRIAVGTNDAFSVRLYGADSQVFRVVRQDGGNAPLEPAEIDRFVARVLESYGQTEDARRRLETGLQQMPRHATLPAFSALRVDRVGNLWVETYTPQGAAAGDWQVFDRDGVLLTRVKMPSLAGVASGPVYFTILDIGADYLLGLVQDQQMLERVVLYRIAK